MKECVACAESIKSNAKLCKHCGTDQQNSPYASNLQEGAQPPTSKGGESLSSSESEGEERAVSIDPESAPKQASAGSGGGLLFAFTSIVIVGLAVAVSVFISSPQTSELPDNSRATTNASVNQANKETDPRSFLVSTGAFARNDVERAPFTEVNLAGFIPEDCSFRLRISELLEGGTTLAIGAVRPEISSDLNASEGGPFYIHQRIFESSPGKLNELSELLSSIQDDSECNQFSSSYESIGTSTYGYLGGARSIRLQYGVDLEGVLVDQTVSFCGLEDCLTSRHTLVLGYRGELAMAASYGGQDFAGVSAVVERAFQQFANG